MIATESRHLAGKEAQEHLVNALAGYICPSNGDIEQMKAEIAEAMEEIVRMDQDGEQLYCDFEIEKGAGKDPRKIRAPKKALKLLQKALSKILARAHVSDAAIAFRPGVNPFEHLKEGIKSCNGSIGGVLQMDLKDFFPSIKRKGDANPVRGAVGRFFNRIFGEDSKIEHGPRLGSEIVTEMTRWATELCLDGDCVPQGAPTSPAISNMFMQPIDAQIIELAKEYGITYLRYADDMIFLCQEGIEEGKLEEFRDKIIEIMEGQNLTVHPDKTDLEVGKSEYEILGARVPAESLDAKDAKLEPTDEYVDGVVESIEILLGDDHGLEGEALTEELQRCAGYISHATNLTIAGRYFSHYTEYPRIGDEVVFLPEKLRELWLKLCEKYADNEEFAEQRNIASRGSKKVISETSHEHTTGSYERRMRDLCNRRGMDYADIEARMASISLPSVEMQTLYARMGRVETRHGGAVFNGDEMQGFKEITRRGINHPLKMLAQSASAKMQSAQGRIEGGILKGSRLYQEVNEIITDLMIISYYRLNLCLVDANWQDKLLIPNELEEQYKEFAKYIHQQSEDVFMAGETPVLIGTGNLFRKGYIKREKYWTSMNRPSKPNTWLSGKRLSGKVKQRTMVGGESIIPPVFIKTEYGDVEVPKGVGEEDANRHIEKLIGSFIEDGVFHKFKPEGEGPEAYVAWIEKELQDIRYYGLRGRRG